MFLSVKKIKAKVILVISIFKVTKEYDNNMKSIFIALIIITQIDVKIVLADVSNPPIFSFLAVPVALYCILCFMLYVAIRIIISIKNSRKSNNSETNASENNETDDVTETTSIGKKSFNEKLRDNYRQSFLILIILIILALLESQCTLAQKRNRLNNLFAPDRR